jgi:hypothetical protein
LEAWANQQYDIRVRDTTSDSRDHLLIAPNLLNCNFTPAAPNQARAADIT